ncbi:MAG: hypothetical protein ACQCXQ_02985, partial [Verrucomicrobiales bacterium]
ITSTLYTPDAVPAATASPAATAQADAAQPTATASTPFAVNRISPMTDGSLIIEFNAEPGANYRIQYSDDAAEWKSCPVSIRAGGTKVQWIDRGPPWTDALPTTKPCRFYRVQTLDN